MANTCRPDVLKAYTKQFQRDFTMFLGLRSEEIKPGGRMVITITGRSIEDPSSKDCCDLWELLAKSLLDMLADVSLFLLHNPAVALCSKLQSSCYLFCFRDLLRRRMWTRSTFLCTIPLRVK